MGTTHLCKYRIEYTSNAGPTQVGLDKLPPPFKDAGRVQGLRVWCEDQEKSEHSGGVNAHCAHARGFLIAIGSAKLIRQADSHVLAEYKAAPFRVL